MIYNLDLYHRRSIRLKGYDYSQSGAYFVTICVQNRSCLFGEIIDKKMQMNAAGKMIDRWWNQLPQKFANVELDDFIVMPNHLHGIIIVGADRRVCPDIKDGIHMVNKNKYHALHRNVSVKDNNSFDNKSGKHADSFDIKLDKYNGSINNKSGEHTGSPLQKPVSLSQMIQWFKTMTTNEYIRNIKKNAWHPFDRHLWQRNYYEHIVRNENEIFRIRKYIIENPIKWDMDDENPKS